MKPSRGTAFAAINLNLINYNTTYTPKHYYRFEPRALKYTKHSLYNYAVLFIYPQKIKKYKPR